MAETGIEHNYDQSVIDGMHAKFLRYFRSTLDSGEPTVLGLENLLSIPQDTSAVLVSTHKSHLDYVVVPWVLQHHHIMSRGRPLAIAAGDNLFKRIAKWNFDRLLRACGAYKIIRKPEPGTRIATTGEQLKYTSERMEARDWFLVFPEKDADDKRGRSYTGKVLPFEPAALGMFQRAERRAGRKAAYVPTTIGYERVPEDRWFTAFANYKSSQSGIKKLLYDALDWPLIMAQQYIGIWNKPIGQIVIRFGTPVTSLEGDEQLSKEEFALKMEKECKSLVTAFPTNIMAAALKQDQNPTTLPLTIKKIQAQLHECGAVPQVRTSEEIIERASMFLNAPFRRFIKNRTLYEINRKDVVNYYNNCIAHYL